MYIFVQTTWLKKLIIIYPNNKCYITKEIKHFFNRKKKPRRNRNRVALQSVQKELNRLLKAARKKQRDILEKIICIGLIRKGCGIQENI